MAQRIHASGVQIIAAGGRVFQLFDAVPPAWGVVLVDITAGFPASPVPHYHYEIGSVASIGGAFVGNAPAAPGSLWVPVSTHPPNIGVWPGGYVPVSLSTPNPQASPYNTGTVRKTVAGALVYRPLNILFWIPVASYTPPAGQLGAPANTEWDVDF
ncbi:MAG: hypothetical protein JNK60_16485 [Acidobacteria bacterium]|nr:hypothetical protein [Acidobacteriota bacterium]